jgi:adenine/guanine/hypoxanthine permease
MASETKPNLKTEVTAGITTFLTMAYIVVVNPSILATEGTGMSFSGVLTATVLLCFTMTLLMGLYAKLPFAVAPGMGLNAFFTFTLILNHKIPWPIALGLTFWAGVVFVIISVTPLREMIASAIPHSLRVALSSGIGIFLAFIGLKNIGLIAANPATLVQLGTIDRKTILAIGGFVLTVWLLKRKSPIAFLAGIAAVTVGALFLGLIQVPTEFFSAPDFSSTFFKMDIVGALSIAFLPAIISILFTDLFDSISTFVGVSQATGLVDEKGEPKNLRQGLMVDSLATMFSGVFGTSAGTAYIESTAGIEAGGRTGWTSVVTALCFLPCFFLAPLVSMIPAYATAPVLVIVGVFMLRGITTLDLSKLEDAVPVLLTMIMIPLTFSITQGILWGFTSYTVMAIISGRGKELKPMMIGLSALSVFLLWMEHGRV